MLMRPRAGLVDSGGVSSEFVLDITRAPTGYLYSDGDRKAINDTAGSNQLNKWAVADKTVPEDGTIRYWEIAVASGAATYTGYMGVVSLADRDGGSGAGTSNPITGTSVGYRGNGEVWSGGTRVVMGSTNYSFGANAIVMIAFNPTTGQFWYGRNGVWRQNPVNQAAIYTTTAGTFYPYIQGREPTEGGALRSVDASFSYAVPDGTVALGA